MRRRGRRAPPSKSSGCGGCRWAGWGAPGTVGGPPALGRSLRLALEEGGVTFVKLGQVLSTRPDLLPVEVTSELGQLQDQVAPAPWPDVEALLHSELGHHPDDVFAQLDPEPVAAASIAQVHRARLLDGSDAVVKIQRPGITSTVEQDLDILGRIARWLEARTP
ncbi:MAG: hypothetical protein GEV08_10365 [Acidimicrobiia bacterium]|nr:hypothetical protein [Acidimicrobiia bacterium]